MIALPFQISETEYSIFLVLQDENFERIKNYDPAEFDTRKVSDEFLDLILRDVIIAYATAEEAAKFIQMVMDDRGIEAMKMLSRNFAFRPDKGDHDNPYGLREG